ncbi:hypothetical protein LA76x_4279 [Lysobacter antibioticus]|uniref:Uncharacterized protein n=1 Tax=Lysobacter antibioticus TaxID=84531 RepID=A0A0S2FFT9_LYSAN|nr:hypothetical protein LA76x_4279 [Lysobacter antibioticus]
MGKSRRERRRHAAMMACRCAPSESRWVDEELGAGSEERGVRNEINRAQRRCPVPRCIDRSRGRCLRSAALYAPAVTALPLRSRWLCSHELDGPTQGFTATPNPPQNLRA